MRKFLRSILLVTFLFALVASQAWCSEQKQQDQAAAAAANEEHGLRKLLTHFRSKKVKNDAKGVPIQPKASSSRHRLEKFMDKSSKIIKKIF